MNARAVTARITCLSALLACLAGVLPAAAQQFPIPLRKVTADGTWDCKDAQGKALTTLVVVGDTYAIITPDSLPGGYGKLHRVSEELVDLPNYIIIDGPLKTEFGFTGTTMHGAAGDPENYSNGMFFVPFTADNTATYCARRLVPGMLQ